MERNNMDTRLKDNPKDFFMILFLIPIILYTILFILVKSAIIIVEQKSWGKGEWHK